MAITRAYNHLKKYGLDSKIITLNESTATVEEAAHALGCTPSEIAKTLGFYVEGKPILVVLKGDAKIDNSKFKRKFGKKGGHMIPLSEVEEVVGHEVGGVCPFGINDGVKVYLDESLKIYDYVYPAAGGTNNTVKLTIEELEEASGYESWVDVVKEG